MVLFVFEFAYVGGARLNAAYRRQFAGREFVLWIAGRLAQTGRRLFCAGEPDNFPFAGFFMQQRENCAREKSFFLNLIRVYRRLFCDGFNLIFNLFI